MKLFLATLIVLPMHGYAQAAATPDTSIEQAFAAMDANGDGLVDRAEYAAFRQARFDRQAAAMDIAFGEMDTNKDGLISKAEAKAVPIIASSFDGLDANGDGLLSAAEMREALIKAQAVEADTH